MPFICRVFASVYEVTARLPTDLQATVVFLVYANCLKTSTSAAKWLLRRSERRDGNKDETAYCQNRKRRNKRNFDPFFFSFFFLFFFFFEHPETLFSGYFALFRADRMKN
jgi:hypothetical protein